MSQQALTQGIHHVGLTVPNIQKTRDFFLEVLGFKQVGEKPDYPAVFVSDGVVMITLWQAVDPDNARGFDRKNCVGLHHVALNVTSKEALMNLHKRLIDTPDVSIEFAPEPLGQLGTHMMCNIPGGVRVEFLATNA